MTLSNETKNLVRKLWSLPLRSCLRCGSLWTHDGLFCDCCWRHLTTHYSSGRLGLRLLPLRSLYLLAWEPGASDSLSELIHCLKGSKHERAWRFYAERFWDLLIPQLGDYSELDCVVVPAPPKEPGERDHAFLLARALTQLSGWPLLTILERASSGPQKKRNRLERKANTLRLSENFSPSLLSGKTVIFVDDIVTTGATALAARQLFPGAKHFEVWSLAWRSLGCD